MVNRPNFGLFNSFFTLLLTITLGCSTAFATVVTTTIKEIIPADSQHSTYLILSESDGIVYEFSESEDRLINTLINTLNIATETHSPVELTVSQNTITSAKLLPKQIKKSLSHHASASIDSAINPVTSTAPYAPSIFTEKSREAETIFQKMAKPSSFRALSQCFRRAEAWTYDLNKEHDVKSMKAFIFFTRKFIRETHFGWWFHVAPFVYVTSNTGEKTEMVLDKSYSEHPVSMYDWMAIFVGQAILCKEAKNYQDYENHQDDLDCMIRKLPMYYYQPDNIEALDKQGVVLNDFVLKDLEDMNLQLKRPRAL